MTLKSILRRYVLNFSILLFIILFTMIHIIKPSLVYDKDGSFREFGVGYREKTIISAWVISILLAIICYIFVSYLAYSV
jgi:hypothetical protein